MRAERLIFIDSYTLRYLRDRGLLETVLEECESVDFQHPAVLEVDEYGTVFLFFFVRTLEEAEKVLKIDLPHVTTHVRFLSE